MGTELVVIPNPVGRPTKYKEEYDLQAFKLSLLGCDDDEIAAFFEVTRSTLSLWKIEYPNFSDSITDGKIKADSQVAGKLYDRAMGAERTEEMAFKVKKTDYDASGKKVQERDEILIVPVKRVEPPDTKAISLWLRNRQKDRWRDDKHVEVNNSGTIVHLAGDLSSTISFLTGDGEEGQQGIGGDIPQPVPDRSVLATSVRVEPPIRPES